ncbi:MAG TPA: hypothetical protein VE978_10880 [Chitinophagales bacterium]|nr:hypothetical protein [Chitinophagales bacterium]
MTILKLPLIIIRKSLHMRGMALYPFIILRDKKFLDDPVIMNHERIHHRQEVELGIIPFYVLYLLNYFVNSLRYPTRYEAYRNIIFEREAYSNEADFDYLNKRKWFSSFQY